MTRSRFVPISRRRAPLNRGRTFWSLWFLVLAFSGFTPAQERRVPELGYQDWRVYGGNSESIRYSALTQINRGNVQRLELAWTHDTGDATEDSEMPCNPIVIGDVLYAVTPTLRIFALEAATGKLLWRVELPGEFTRAQRRSRGLVWWGDEREGRIFATKGPYLYALDSRSGRLVPGFGDSGRIDLRVGLGRPPETLRIWARTPGVVYRDLLIQGSVMSEGLPAPPGDVRAYDVRSGELRWSFHTIPHPGEPGYETWPEEAWKYAGAANSWAGMSVDQQRGLVFIPTGSASFDFYGANRHGDNLFANSLIALRAATGERVWHFQFVRHDLWDRDIPAQPSLVTVKRDGRLVDAVAQITKSGHVFVFDRERGTPLFPIEYRPAPATDVEGERVASSQPFPLKPPPFARQRLTEEMVTRRTPEAHKAVLEQLRGLRNEGPFTPPSLQGTVIFPGFDGGANWGGAAFDPETGLLYVNANEMAWILQLVERSRSDQPYGGRQLYLDRCAGCHRADLRGTPPEFPSLLHLRNRSTEPEIVRMILEGGGRMPTFHQLEQDELQAVARYLLKGEDTPLSRKGRKARDAVLRYRHAGYVKLLDPDGYPGTEPPWGTLTAIDLDRGEITWQIPFGEFPELAAQGLRNTGTENYGGPVVTAGGLVFIGATNHDSRFRAFDKATGRLLWETGLPAGGNATPAVYQVGGRQFVVIAAGGGKSGAPSGGSYLAFSLPDGEIESGP